MRLLLIWMSHEKMVQLLHLVFQCILADCSFFFFSESTASNAYFVSGESSTKITDPYSKIDGSQNNDTSEKDKRRYSNVNITPEPAGKQSLHTPLWHSPTYYFRERKNGKQATTKSKLNLLHIHWQIDNDNQNSCKPTVYFILQQQISDWLTDGNSGPDQQILLVKQKE